MLKVLVSLVFCYCLFSCSDDSKAQEKHVFSYQEFKDSILQNRDTLPDSTNLFDKGPFVPGVTSMDTFLLNIDTVLARLKRQDFLSAAERTAVIENLRMLDSFYKNKDTISHACKEETCGLYAHVVKSSQKLFLYLDGELKDSFPVSTGMKKYTTPDMSIQPRGPVFTRYTSRKFPGGNYKGLGNMPYAVFVKGGYAIHGTTPGNFSKLGHIASHGCIRLHPDNARIFYELVRLYGLNHTWVKVSDI